ncbi:MAG TPA: DUF1987 domain-containing protein [Bacteroidales bacterium]|jgi:Site-specific recombinase XerD
MENLHININPELVYYPIIDFNYQSGICEISGESYMEETYKFYEPVINWLENYIREKRPVVLNIKLTYFNTSSSRFILEILYILKKYKNEGGSAEVNWYYKNDDPDILTEINDFIEETGIDIHIFTF